METRKHIYAITYQCETGKPTGHKIPVAKETPKTYVMAQRHYGLNCSEVIAKDNPVVNWKRGGRTFFSPGMILNAAALIAKAKGEQA